MHQLCIGHEKHVFCRSCCRHSKCTVSKRTLHNVIKEQFGRAGCNSERHDMATHLVLTNVQTFSVLSCAWGLTQWFTNMGYIASMLVHAVKSWLVLYSTKLVKKYI